MDEIKIEYRCRGWRGDAHLIAEYRGSWCVCIYKGYHNHRRREVVLYPWRVCLPFYGVGKKIINEREIKR
nr:MAG TPA: hypothetical protein [Caudoviricetes sp.]